MAVETGYISKMGRDYKVSPHFTLGEIASKDGADKVLYSEELLAKLEEARSFGGFTVSVNSFYRSAAHNKRVGGASNSSHTRGLAADVVFKKDGRTVNAELICCLCQSLGFDGVAYISPSAVHLDMAGRTYRGDERKGYSNNVGGDFYKFFNIKKSQVEALKVNVPKEEEEEMTQEQFNRMMNVWISQQAAKDPGDWSKEARAWAEANGIMTGTGAGNSYGAPATREQVMVFLHRFAKEVDPIK
jgi:hypothetical protein